MGLPSGFYEFHGPRDEAIAKANKFLSSGRTITGVTHSAYMDVDSSGETTLHLSILIYFLVNNSYYR